MLNRLHNSDDSEDEERAFVSEEKKRKDVSVVTMNHFSDFIFTQSDELLTVLLEEHFKFWSE